MPRPCFIKDDCMPRPCFIVEATLSQGSNVRAYERGIIFFMDIRSNWLSPLRGNFLFPGAELLFQLGHEAGA